MTTRGPGRPPLADIEELRAASVEVLIREGWSSVSMKRIAEESGLSLRTMHRYFPTKADIVWGDIDSSFEALRVALEKAADELSILETVIEVVVEELGPLDERPGWGRDRIRLIALNPELQVIHSRSFAQWRSELTNFVARRLGEPSDSLVAATSGAAIQSVIMESLAWWATHPGSSTPAEAIAQGLLGLTRTSAPNG